MVAFDNLVKNGSFESYDYVDRVYSPHHWGKWAEGSSWVSFGKTSPKYGSMRAQFWSKDDATPNITQSLTLTSGHTYFVQYRYKLTHDGGTVRTQLSFQFLYGTGDSDYEHNTLQRNSTTSGYVTRYFLYTAPTDKTISTMRFVFKNQENNNAYLYLDGLMLIDLSEIYSTLPGELEFANRVNYLGGYWDNGKAPFPAPPKNIRAVSEPGGGPNCIRVSWDAAASQGYDVSYVLHFRKNGEGGKGKLVGTFTSTSTSVDLSKIYPNPNVTVNDTITWEIFTFVYQGSGNLGYIKNIWSNYSPASAPSKIPIPAPTSVKAAPGYHDFKPEWTVPNNGYGGAMTRYRVYLYETVSGADVLRKTVTLDNAAYSTVCNKLSGATVTASDFASFFDIENAHTTKSYKLSVRAEGGYGPGMESAKIPFKIRPIGPPVITTVNPNRYKFQPGWKVPYRGYDYVSGRYMEKYTVRVYNSGGAKVAEHFITSDSVLGVTNDTEVKYYKVNYLSIPTDQSNYQRFECTVTAEGIYGPGVESVRYGFQIYHPPGQPTIDATASGFDTREKTLRFQVTGSDDAGLPSIPGPYKYKYVYEIRDASDVRIASGSQLSAKAASISVPDMSVIPDKQYRLLVKCRNDEGDSSSVSSYFTTPQLLPSTALPPISGTIMQMVETETLKDGKPSIKLNVPFPGMDLSDYSGYACINKILLYAVCKDTFTDIEKTIKDYRLNCDDVDGLKLEHPSLSFAPDTSDGWLCPGNKTLEVYKLDTNTMGGTGINAGRTYKYVYVAEGPWGTVRQYADGTPYENIGGRAFTTLKHPAATTSPTAVLNGQYIEENGEEKYVFEAFISGWGISTAEDCFGREYVTGYRLEREMQYTHDEGGVVKTEVVTDAIRIDYDADSCVDDTHTIPVDIGSTASDYIKYRLIPLSAIWDKFPSNFEGSSAVYGTGYSGWSENVKLPVRLDNLYIPAIGGRTGSYYNIAYNKIIWQLPDFSSIEKRDVITASKDNTLYEIYRSEKDSDAFTDYVKIATTYGRDTTYYDGAKPLSNPSGNFIRPNTPYWYKVVMRALGREGVADSKVDFTQLPRVKIISNNFVRRYPEAMGTNGAWKCQVGLLIDTDGHPKLRIESSNVPAEANTKIVAEISERNGPWKTFAVEESPTSSYEAVATKSNAALKFGTDYSLRMRAVNKDTNETGMSGHSNIVNVSTYQNNSASFPNMMPNAGFQYGVVKNGAIADDDELYDIKPTGTWVTYRTDGVDGEIDIIDTDNLNNADNTTSFKCDRALKINRAGGQPTSRTTNVSNYKFPNITLTKDDVSVKTEQKKYAIVARAARRDASETIGLKHYTLSKSTVGALYEPIELQWETRNKTYVENQTDINAINAPDTFVFRNSQADMFAGTFVDVREQKDVLASDGIFQPRVEFVTTGTGDPVEVLISDVMLFDLSLVFGGNGVDVMDTTSEITAQNVIQLVKTFTTKWYDFNYDAEREIPPHQFVKASVRKPEADVNGSVAPVTGRDIDITFYGLNDVIGGYDTCGYLPVKSYAVQYRRTGTEFYTIKSPLYPADEIISQEMSTSLTGDKELIQNGTNYQIRYQYSNVAGDSLASEAVFVETLHAPGEINDVTASRMYENGVSKLRLTWTRPEFDENYPIEGYVVGYGTNKNEVSWKHAVLEGGEGTTRGCELTVEPNKVYYIRVLACDKLTYDELSP